MSAVFKLPLLLAPQPEGGFTVTCPLIPELITEGDTVEEALENVRDALAAVIELYQEERRPMPANLTPDLHATPIWFEGLVSTP